MRKAHWRRRGIMLERVSVEEKDIGVGHQLCEHEKDGQIQEW